MSDYLLTSSHMWIYAFSVFRKLKTGFDSLSHKRIPPLSGFFVSVIYICPFCFYGWVFWGAERLAGLVSGLSTRSIRPPVSRTGGGFSKTVEQKGALP